MGFEINQFNRSLANKLIDGKMCTLLWHIDDIKFSHCNAQVVNGVVNDLGKEYGKESRLTVSRGRQYDYLGMVINYSRHLTVIVTKFNFISNMLTELPLDMDSLSTTPAPLHLFGVNENAKVLDEPTARFLHHTLHSCFFVQT